MKNLIMAFAIPAIFAYCVTPFVKQWAEKVKAIDVPKDNRRVHKKPTPLLGGLSIYFACIVGMLLYLPLNKKIVGVLIGATIIVICGYFDDKKPLSPKVKFAVQILAAIIAMYCGARIDRITNPLDFLFNAQWIELGVLAYPVTVFWIVGLTNAFNLIDGLDGLAAGLSVISSLTLMVVALLTGPENPYIITMTAILAGSILGFLPYNFNPAKIFMGDTGAMFLGYMLSVISVLGVLKSAAALSMLVPIFAMGLPIFDTLFAIIRRFANGKSVVEGDKGHLHHRLLDKGYSQKKAVLTLYSISAILGAGAVALVETKLKTAYILVFVVFLLASMGVKYLGLLETGDTRNKYDA